jgi:hypothetical protein
MSIPEACRDLADELDSLHHLIESLQEERQNAAFLQKAVLWIRTQMAKRKLKAKERELEQCVADSATEQAEDWFEVTFGGTVTIEIDHSNAALRRPHTLPITFALQFNADRTQVRLPRFPAIETAEFDTPYGRNRTTVWRIGRKVEGTFDPVSGRMDVPIRLLFDHSLDVPFIEEDSELSFAGEHALTTGEARSPSGAFVKHGSPLDRATREISLVGASVFVGGDKVLGGCDCGIQITGQLSRLP